MDDVQVKLRRAITNSDGMEPPDIEEFGIDRHGQITSRYCAASFYKNQPWTQEVEAIEELIGFYPKSEKLIEGLRKEIMELDTLEPYKGPNSLINYGRY